jgi:hypothetical protein
MRFHKIVRASVGESHRVIAYDPTGDMFRYLRLLRAETFNPADLHALTLMLDGSEPVDYLPNPLSLPLCSHRFRDTVLAMCVGQVEFVPVRLHSPAGMDDRYLFMNVTRQVDCVDLERSVVPKRPGRTKPQVIEFAFVADRIPDGVHILKVPECRSSIFLSEPLAKSFTSGFTGFGFLPNRV